MFSRLKTLLSLVVVCSVLGCVHVVQESESKRVFESGLPNGIALDGFETIDYDIKRFKYFYLNSESQNPKTLLLVAPFGEVIVRGDIYVYCYYERLKAWLPALLVSSPTDKVEVTFVKRTNRIIVNTCSGDLVFEADLDVLTYGIGESESNSNGDIRVTKPATPNSLPALGVRTLR